MNDQTIETRVREIIAGHLKVPMAITPTTSFFKNLALDSLDVVEMIMELEEEFGITIRDTDVAKLGVVADLTNYIKVKIAARPPSQV